MTVVGGMEAMALLAGSPQRLDGPLLVSCLRPGMVTKTVFSVPAFVILTISVGKNTLVFVLLPILTTIGAHFVTQRSIWKTSVSANIRSFVLCPVPRLAPPSVVVLPLLVLPRQGRVFLLVALGPLLPWLLRLLLCLSPVWPLPPRFILWPGRRWPTWPRVLGMHASAARRPRMVPVVLSSPWPRFWSSSLVLIATGLWRRRGTENRYWSVLFGKVAHGQVDLRPVGVTDGPVLSTSVLLDSGSNYDVMSVSLFDKLQALYPDNELFRRAEPVLVRLADQGRFWRSPKRLVSILL